MNTEELILKKTFGLLLLKGFDATSITDIQVATGLSRGLLYHYFKNKEELFIQVTEKFFIQIFDFDIRKAKDYTVTEFIGFMCDRFCNISKVISGIVEETGSIKDVSMLNYYFLFYQVMQRDAIFRNNYRTTTEKERTGWEYALKNSIERNEIRIDIDVDVSANQLFTLTDGIWFQGIFSSDGQSVIRNLENTLRHYITLLK
ncbi:MULTISPECIES: helix-turn-helix domain-containing protein [unclassified Dysgonomonas]|jgi:AcrR family transcriptional regulator|uniref:TetR/AcrR family transcriptional regulator n=1 Tax=unclassified Dysgonomonas TaxID=2630389 RepID=UPI0025C04F86|nr:MULTISPECIES: helix-turn-helix domain-containing protein [unclassified Dysgonomonas]MDR2001842.1 TetR/AcrR family transcriptional regulator [Prevotella sp.]HMM04210.1 helix-turn-helix domain-containing protein [Dysgonomonas sp.]